MKGGNHESYNDWCLNCAGRCGLLSDGGESPLRVSSTFFGFTVDSPLARGSSATLSQRLLVSLRLLDDALDTLLNDTAGGRRDFLFVKFKVSLSFIASNFICTTLVLSSLVSCAVRRDL